MTDNYDSIVNAIDRQTAVIKELILTVKDLQKVPAGSGTTTQATLPEGAFKFGPPEDGVYYALGPEGKSVGDVIDVYSKAGKMFQRKITAIAGPGKYAISFVKGGAK